MKSMIFLILGVSSKKGILYYWLSFWSMAGIMAIAPLIRLATEFEGSIFASGFFYFLPLTYALTCMIMSIYFILKAHSQELSWLKNKIIDRGSD